MAINATPFNPNDTDNEQDGQQDQFMSKPVSISGSEAQDASGGAPSAPNTTPGNASSKPTSSGRFQNLNAYLKANQNFNSQGGGLAGKVNQNLTSRSNNLQKNFAQAQNDYQTSLNNARQRYDSQFVDNTLKNPTIKEPAPTVPANNPTPGTFMNPIPGAPQQQVSTQVQTPGTFMNPVSQAYTPAPGNTPGTFMNPPAENTTMPVGNIVAGDHTLPEQPQGLQQSDIDRFQQMLNASYKGPTGLDPNLNVQASNFSNLAGNTASEQGRFNLLQNLYNKPTYSAGQRTLDNLFLQSNPSQIATLQGSRTTANQLNNNLRQAQTTAGLQAQDATNEANNTRESTRNALTGAVTGFDTSMQEAAKQAMRDRDISYQNELAGLGGKGISYEDAVKFGLARGENATTSDPTYNLDLRKYLQESNINPTAQTVASAADYNKIAGLQKLAGGYGNEDISKVFDAYNNPTQAGTFAKESPYDFNQAAYKNDLTQAQTNYQNDLKSKWAGSTDALPTLQDAVNNLHAGEAGSQYVTNIPQVLAAYNQIRSKYGLGNLSYDWKPGQALPQYNYGADNRLNILNKIYSGQG